MLSQSPPQTSTIQPLPRDVVKTIAAGEVMDSIAAVVRELGENSLDAGATRITIALEPDLWRIQVADNGTGMTLTDLRVCAMGHSTSKIRSQEDLHNITTLGFRGEALHSLAQVADLEIKSRPKIGSNPGWGLVYHQDSVVREEPVAMAPGTIVTVANLFGNWPVRRKGLPSISQQLKTIQTIIGNMALCHPQVTWLVLLKERPWLKISPGMAAIDIIPQILKQVRVSDLQLLQEEITTSSGLSHLELVIGLPDRCHRPKADWLKIAVNGRVVRSPQLEQTAISAFSRTLPRHRYPICFLHLHLPPSKIDFHRHPAKVEIYLQDLESLQEGLEKAIEKALRINPGNFPEAENPRLTQLLKASEKKGAYHLNKDLKTTPPEEPAPKTNPNIDVFQLRAVAQVSNTYIVAEHSGGIWLIEQHIAHERVLYEELQDSWELVTLEKPIVLSQLKITQLEQLERLGLEVECFGEDLWAVRTIPAMLKERDDIAPALIELSLGGDLEAAQTAIACRSAIRNGTPLNLTQMQRLLDEWKHTRNPRTCPHGRPIYLSLEESALARFFRRHWVIGKSHGI
ncbi:MAG: DNA mismatch repair endonuclease MutL [Prochloron sp. SP5CPC1]|nr:DNA mismatch repair endonuclease MutL [Candidatus Paraprochloron terpiosi SP5CPC1]